MRFYRSTIFKRKYKRLTQSIQRKVDARLLLFAQIPYDPLLDNHKLHGKYSGCRSINVTGDYRIIFEHSGDECLLILIGTHAELYGT